MWVTLDDTSKQPLTRQLFEQIRARILSGEEPHGSKLPSTRRLAAELGISRNTVVEAYSQLDAEGYLEASHGSATRVAGGIPILSLSKQASRDIPAKEKSPAQKPSIDFRTGIPALEHFPRVEWSRLYRETCTDLPTDSFGYTGAFGVQRLQETLCRYLHRVRGIACHPDQIMITTGATQGLSLLARLLHREGKKVLVEDPSHPGLRAVITAAGCVVEPIAVDEKGMLADRLWQHENPAFIYVTPSHQYPIGGVLPIQRRLELIRFAQERGCFIVEDDYDSEFRYSGRPVSAMVELEPERVVYLGSFSKTLSPALRLGYAIIPHAMIHNVKTEKVYTDVHTDALGQHTLAGFLENGGFERHIWKMKKLYSRKRNTLLESLESAFPGLHKVLGDASGLHLVVQLHGHTFTKALIKQVLECGVRVYPVSSLYLHRREPGDLLIFGYSHLGTEQIQDGVRVLARCLAVNASVK